MESFEATLRSSIVLTFFILSITDALGREDVQSDLSAHSIAIESNFTGARVVLFGTIEDGYRAAEEAGIYDLVVVIRGPDESLIARRKQRTLGLWVNRQTRTFGGVPSYYAVLSTRPLNQIADSLTLNSRGIGFDSLLPAKNGNAAAKFDSFRQAVLRIRQRDGRFVANERGVIFISKTLFRATLELPSSVVDGEYSADVFLFRGRRLVSLNQRKLNIHKEGFGRLIYTTAFDYPLIYGIIAVLVAIMVGLSASAIIRRE